MRPPDHASAPPGTGPLTARLVVRHAWAMTRGRRGRIAAAAAAFFVPAALVWFAAEELRPTPDETWAVRVALAALVVVGANLAWTLGVVAFAGFLDLAVGDHYFRRRPHTLGTVLRTLPWGALVVVDVLLVAALVVGLAAAVVPGIVVGILFGLVGPVVVHERRRPLDALRRTARISRPHWPLVLGLVVVPWWIEAVLSEAVRETAHGAGLLLHAAVEWFLAGTLLAAVGVLEVALAAELMARTPDRATGPDPAEG
jgi:hypothetical protein